MTLRQSKIHFKMFCKIMDGKIKRLKHAVMGSYSVLAINTYITDDNFHYTVCGMVKLLQVSCHLNS